MPHIRWTIKDLAETIDKMQENEFDCIIFVTGKRGIGKSSFAYKLANRLKSPFNPERDIAYKRDEVIRLLAKKKKGIIFSDELVNVAFNRDFYEQGQKQLIKALNMYRDSCNVFIGCIPMFATMDNQLKSLCKIRVDVVRRGVAIIQTQIHSMYTSDPWDIRNNQKIERKWVGRKNPKYSQFSTYRGILRFNDLREDQKIKYERIKHEKRNKIFKEGEEPVEAKSKYSNLAKLIEEGKIWNKGMLMTFCEGMDLKFTNTQIAVNRLLKDKGSESITLHFKKAKPPESEVTRDKLGFGEGLNKTGSKGEMAL